MLCSTKSALEYSLFFLIPQSVTPPGLDVARDRGSPCANKYAWIIQSHPLSHSCCNCLGPSEGNSEDIGGKGFSEMSVACQFFTQTAPSDKMKALYWRSWPLSWHREQLCGQLFSLHICALPFWVIGCTCMGEAGSHIHEVSRPQKAQRRKY